MPKRTGAVHVSETFQVVRNRPHGQVAAALGTLRKIGLEGLLGSRPSRERDLAMAMVVSRILKPSSKLATCRSLVEETKTSTLGEVLDLGSLDEDDLYEAMDWLVARPGRGGGKVGQKHPGGG